MERDAKYATIALFALACVAAAVAFIWWYSGRGDQRDYQKYEIYFQGTVSGLSKGSPGRYLGVDVGRVTYLGVDTADPGQVKVVADIDSSAPISGGTLAKLGLLGLTGLLYIDLQQNPDGSLTIQVRADEPDQRTNWLPAPAGKDFSLYLRAYWPQVAITDGSWTPPAVQQVN